MRFLCIAITALLMIGCQYDPYAHLYTTERPKDTDVAGIYNLAEQTLTRNGLSFLQDKNCSIDLRADHTFVATNFPDWRETQPVEYFLDGLHTRNGTWQIESVGSIDDGSRPLKTHWGIRLNTNDTNLWCAGLTSKKPPYGFIFGYGDPDSGTVMQFIRTR